jgi:hypothetical protein
LYGFWNLARVWKLIQGEFKGNLDMGIFLKSSTLLKDFLENEIFHAMICNIRKNYLEKILPYTIVLKYNLMYF